MLSPLAPAMDHPSGNVCFPASQYVPLPHRNLGAQYLVQPAPEVLPEVAESPTLARPRRTRASKPKGEFAIHSELYVLCH